MEIKINSKFSIGDIVQRYEKRYIHETKIQCPLCKRNYKVKNPRWDPFKDGEDCEYLKCPFCKEGWFYKYREERYLYEELYRITEIIAYIDNDKDIIYRYTLNSTSQPNDKDSLLITRLNVDERDLVKVRDC